MGLRKNAASFLLGQGSVLVLSFMANVLIARNLDIDSYGTYAYLLALVMLVMPFVDVGMSGYYTVESGRERAKADGNYSRATLLKTILLLVLGLPAFLYMLSTEILTPHNFLPLLAYFLGMILSLHSDILFVPKEKGLLWAMRKIIFDGLNILLLLVAILYFSANTSDEFLVATGLAALIAGLVSFASSARLSSMSFYGVFNAGNFRNLLADLKGMIPFAIWRFFSVLQNRGAIVLLAISASLAAAAEFRIVFLCMTILLYLPRGLNMAVMPRVAKYEGEEKYSEQSTLVLRAWQVVNSSGIMIVFFSAPIGGKLISWIFGDAYEGLDTVWVIASIAVTFMFIQIFLSGLLNHIGYASTNSKQMGIGVVVFLLMGLILSSSYGASGMIVSYLFSALILITMNASTVKNAMQGRMDWLFGEIGKSLLTVLIWSIAYGFSVSQSLDQIWVTLISIIAGMLLIWKANFLSLDFEVLIYKREIKWRE